MLDELRGAVRASITPTAIAETAAPHDLTNSYPYNGMKLQNVIHFVVSSIVILVTMDLILSIRVIGVTVQASDPAQSSQTPTDPDWSELIASMDKMHMAMGAVKRSGDGDVDFVRLMLPHHQAAIDMAKTQLLYGKDPQMRRLAQEIITDQQLEIELMQRWLKQQRAN
jgi:Uncharacterized protein conserved in bacteria